MNFKELVDEINSGKYNTIFLIIVFILLFHLYFKVDDKNIETMADSSLNSQIAEAVKQYYLSDEFIKNLSIVSTQLQKDGGLSISGDLTVSGKFNYLPRGTIVAYNQNTPPAGWTLCDGSNGSPNLTNRFILGWGNRGIGTIGGEETVTLIEAQMPSHSHGMSASGDHVHRLNSDWIVWPPGTFQRNFTSGGFSGGDRASQGFAKLNQFGTTNAGSHTHSIHNAGGNQSHNNMPPFYVLTYIMKL
jgi:microcystin-dependent protein